MRNAVARIALALALGTMAGVGPAGAAPPPKPPTPVVNSWALAPTGTNPSEPSSRVYLSYDLAPGATVRDSVTLWNYSNVQLTFSIYATDAFNNGKGAFELLPGAKKPSDAGTWVTLPQANVTAAPRSKIDLPLTLKVPPDARPGDHAGAILAANQAQGRGPDGKVVLLDRRTGSRMYIRILGPVHPALIVENVHTVYHSSVSPLNGTLDVTYTVRNAGNVRLSAHQRVRAKGPFGLAAKTHRPADVPELLPDNAITLHEHFSGLPAMIRATADISLEPFSTASDVKAPLVRRGGHTWAIPWGVVVLLLALGLVRRSYTAMRRRRRELAGRSSPEERLAPVP